MNANERAEPRYTTDISTPSDLQLVATRTFDAPRELVFAAHVDPRHLPHWMLGPDGWAMTACEVDLRPGGAWRFEWSHADGGTMEMRGTYREIVPPARLVYTESWGDQWPATVNRWSSPRRARGRA